MDAHIHMECPRLTILMSCYNASRYLREAVESILNQTYRDFEFLVVNDGSKDDTLEIIESYARQDNRIVVIDKANTGLADSLNVGLAAAKGQWIARQDADDISLPDRLARQIAFLDRHPSVILLGTGCTLIDERATPGRDVQFPTGHDAIVRQMTSGGSPFPHASAIFRKQSAAAVKGYNSRFVRSQDVDLWLRLSQRGQMACLPEVLVKLRKHGDNISTHNSGPTQMIMGMAARTCHLLRMRGVPDPSQDSDDTVWEGFLEWLAKRLEQRSYFESRRQWSTLRQDFHSAVQAGGPLRGMLRLSGELLASGNALRILKNRLSASSLPSRLTKEWIAPQESTCRAAISNRQYIGGQGAPRD